MPRPDPLETWKELDEIASIGKIARRYFAIQAFDGVVTLIGVLVGSMAAGVTNPAIVMTTGISTAVAMGISGLWGAYLTEAAERRRELDALERHTLTKLDDTRIGQASRAAVAIASVVDGLAPTLAALLVLVPFMVYRWLPSVQAAYLAALGVALLTLFFLGVFLGRVSRQNLAFYGLKTTMAGLASIAIGLALESCGAP